MKEVADLRWEMGEQRRRICEEQKAHTGVTREKSM